MFTIWRWIRQIRIPCKAFISYVSLSLRRIRFKLTSNVITMAFMNDVYVINRAWYSHKRPRRIKPGMCVFRKLTRPYYTTNFKTNSLKWNRSVFMFPDYHWIHLHRKFPAFLYLGYLSLTHWHPKMWLNFRYKISKYIIVNGVRRISLEITLGCRWPSWWYIIVWST